jgi:hypothetical protein
MLEYARSIARLLVIGFGVGDPKPCIRSCAACHDENSSERRIKFVRRLNTEDWAR